MLRENRDERWSMSFQIVTLRVALDNSRARLANKPFALGQN